MFFHIKHHEQQESFAFKLVGKCLETDETEKQEERQLSRVEFVVALVGVTFIVAAVRGVVWLFCGC
jgi:hypothetical protein